MTGAESADIVNVIGRAGSVSRVNYEDRCKMAAVVAYIGDGFMGFQRQPGHPTIEGELHQALATAGAVPSSEPAAFVQMHWARTARTDKGVSAAANVVSFIPSPPVERPEQLVAAANAALPPSVRLLHAAHVGRRFDARRSCSGRRYEFLVPLWALDPTVGLSRAAKLAAAAVAAKADGMERLAAVAGDARIESATPSAVQCVASIESDTARSAEGGSIAAEGVGTSTEVRRDQLTSSEIAQSGRGILVGGNAPLVPSAVSAAIAAAARPAPLDMTTASAASAAAIDALGTGKGGCHGTGVDFGSGSSKGGARSERGIRRQRGKALDNVWRPEKRTRADRHGIVWAEGDAERKTAQRAAEEVASSQFILSTDAAARLDRVLACFEGTYSYHNFTSEPVAPGSIDAQRSIQRFFCGGLLTIKPAAEVLHQSASVSASASTEVQGNSMGTSEGERETAAYVRNGQNCSSEDRAARDGADASDQKPHKYVRIVVEGTSFMMYQIRKMVGLALAVYRGAADVRCIAAALSIQNKKLNIPTAPASGLLLDGPFFGHYNEATATSPDAGVPFYVSAVQEHVDSFKQERIYPAIARGDPTEVWLFLKSLTEAAFGFSKWISADTVWEKSSGIRSCS
mmetsp:Transcript_23549/g.69957  ORF Transcript_23549/g.69957 Transcript_23549/m.69957 type:complete len:629 (+) Transcript_23549:3303-5189(+)